MKIIDNKKDYYDYLQGVLGTDEKVIYDRRGSTVVGASEFYDFNYPSGFDIYFSKKPFKYDGKKVKKNQWQSCKYKNRIDRRWSWKAKDKYEEEGSIYHLYLEVGYHTFIIEIERYLDDDNELKIDTSIVDTKELNKETKKSKAPLYLSEYHFTYGSHVGDGGTDNPILTNTFIPGVIPAQDMWNMLYEYISSLNDKEFTDSRTNDQHIESHGFDRKISFRHRKK